VTADRHILRWILGAIAVAGVLAALVAAGTIWLLLTDPVAVSTSIGSGSLPSLVRATLVIVYQAFLGLVRYL
jgi:hypothetical protein